MNTPAPGVLLLAGKSAWLLIVGLTLIVTTAAIALVLWLRKRRAAAAAPGEDSAASKASGEVRFLIDEANRQLAASAGIRKGGNRIADLPLVLLVGEPGSTKTSVVEHSGLSPELIAGAVYEGAQLRPRPTETGNIWLSSGWLFAEAGGALLSQPDVFARFVSRLRAARISNLLGKTGQSPRSVVVCFDCGIFLQENASIAVEAASQKLRGLLGRVAQAWGNRVPVYVLFTRLDRIPFFLDYVRNMQREEAGQVFGKLVPLSASLNAGVYRQEQTNRLDAAFEALFRRLAEKRIDYLGRESDAALTANTYEFPREFGKRKDLAVSFMVDLCRPSQLRASPFLRGFFFTGVRPLVIEEPGPTPAPAPHGEPPPDLLEVTGIYLGGQRRPAPQPLLQIASRRVPQWVFLAKFASDALLGDRVAMDASGASTRAGPARRYLYAAAALLAIIFFIGATCSYFFNAKLAAQVEERRRALAKQPKSAALPALALLESMRIPVQQITAFERRGAPLRHRWGLYPGTALYDNARHAYCAELKDHLLADTRMALVSTLRNPHFPPVASRDDYTERYRSVKALLLATSAPESLIGRDKFAPNAEFLQATLTSRWRAAAHAGAEETSQASRQFDFFARERAEDFCPLEGDADALADGRRYLCQFPLADRIYGELLQMAGGGPKIFFLDPAGAVSDSKQVSAAYSKEGWKAFHDALKNVGISQEDWVLGKCPNQVETPAAAIQSAGDRYERDFIAQWQQFLDAGKVTPYTEDLNDAAKKLSALAGNDSGLLKLFCKISQNTNVDSPAVKARFQPIQLFTPPDDCAAHDGKASANAQYLNDLIRLKLGVGRVLESRKPEQETLPEAQSAQTAAELAAHDLSMPANGAKLLLDPTKVENLMRSLAANQLNSGGGEACQALKPFIGKYPFNLKSQDEASVEDVIRLLHPKNGVWRKVGDNAVKNGLAEAAGDGYAPAANGAARASEALKTFLKNAQAMSQALFPTGREKPGFSYKIENQTAASMESFTLQIGDKKLRGAAPGGQSETFLWPSEGLSINYRVKDGGEGSPPALKGIWSIFHFIDGAKRSFGGGVYEWDDVNARTTILEQNSNKTLATLRLKITGNEFLQKRGMQLTCPAKISETR